MTLCTNETLVKIIVKVFFTSIQVKSHRAEGERKLYYITLDKTCIEIRVLPY